VNKGLSTDCLTRF